MKLKKYLFGGFGFPIELQNVPARLVLGEYEPVINYKDLANAVIVIICSDENKKPLTGKQVFFIRNHFEMTIRDFGAWLEVTHAAVKKWENCGDKATNMSDSAEKVLRLKCLDKLGLKPTEFVKIFKKMDIDRNIKNSKTPLQIAL